MASNFCLNMSDKMKDYYSPDVWAIIKIKTDKETLYKLLCGWYGGFAGADEWRLNSGIKSWSNAGEFGYSFIGYSGSEYKVHRSSERFSGLTSSILNNLKNQAEVHGFEVEHIDFNDFMKEFKND